MIYKNLSIEELREYPYPNLMAELINSGYSICTLAEHMGLGELRREDDPEVWAKMKGDCEISCSEALGLAGLFGVKAEYLFNYDLKVFCDEPMAYWRWHDENKRKEREHQEYQAREEIIRKLREKPYLLDFMKQACTWNKEEVQWVTKVLNEQKEAAECRK